jgi:hypothetical protein
MTDITAYSVPIIAAFVYVLNEATKTIAKACGKDVKRYIPIFSIVYGLILGVCGYFIPSMNTGSDIITAIIVGIASGLASTGGHQVGHQLVKPDTESEQVDYDQVEDILEEDEDYDDEEDDPEEEDTEVLTPVEKATVDMLQDTDEETANLNVFQIPEDDE